MSKEKIFNSFNAEDEYNKALHALRNKYYNLYRSNIKTTGLNHRQEEYVMKKFWAEGTVAAFNIKLADELGFAPWTMSTWDMYGEPEKVRLVNERGSTLIPYTDQVVDKDVVIGYIQSNHKPLKLIVDWYLERIAQVEAVINTNLQLQKMPYLIPVDKTEVGKVKNVIDRILNNEIVICVDGVEPTVFKAISTQAPYIIDKLRDYEKSLENDLKTVMGINNPGEAKAEQLQLAEINSNNAEINSADNDYQKNLDDFSKAISEVLGKTIKFEVIVERAVHDGQIHENEAKTGPQGDNYED